nr:hypothetical protein [uncultured bacterium]
MKKRKSPHNRLRMLRYNHWGAILSTASILGTNPTNKSPMIKREGRKLEVSSDVCLGADFAISYFSLLICKIKIYL